MRKLLVLGAGCPKCRQLVANTEAAAKALALEYELAQSDSIDEMLRYGILTPPALVVDGELKVMGQAPPVAELKELLA